jgi:competence protein ComEC
MKFITYDVEHGSSHVLWIPNNVEDVMVWDAGSKNGFSPALNLKNSWNVESIRWLHITHQDSDHLTDIENFEVVRPSTLTRPKVSREYLENHHGSPLPETVQKFLDFEKSFNAPALPVEDPSHDWGGVQFSRFHNNWADFPNLNNISLVTFVKYQGWSILLPGDLERQGWLALLENEAFRQELSKVDILVASHHGRDSGFCEEVFNKDIGGCNPYITIISDKSTSDTSVTHKYSAVSKGLNVVGQGKRKVLTTRNDGAIHVRINPEGKYSIKLFETGN